ncbi:MAG: metallophosphoesterase family protein [Fusobacteriaceae bacterium]
MKILHSSDWHLGKKLEGQKRIEEQKKFINKLVEIADNEEIDLVLVAGDIYDNSNPSAEAESLFFDAMKMLSKNGERAVIVIPGNHDNPQRLSVANSLAKEFGIIIYETPFEKKEIGKYGNFKVVKSTYGGIEIEINCKKAFIYCLPYPSEVALNEEFSEKNYSKRIGEILKKGIEENKENIPNIIMTHIFVSGANATEDERAIELGGSLAVSIEDLPEVDYIALGHIHRPMKFIKKRAYYCGSPIEYRINENKYDKRVFIAKLNGNLNNEFKEIELENYKPILKYRVNGANEAILLAEEKEMCEEWIYLEILTAAYLTNEEIKKIKINKNILEIKPIFTDIRNLELEVEEISTKKTILENFIEYYSQCDGIEPSQEVKALFLKMMESDN